MGKATGAQIGVRLQADVVKRVDALRLKLSKHPTVAALGKVTRATVIKLAVARGLDVLEAEHK